jgi:hypothetical protein
VGNICDRIKLWEKVREKYFTDAKKYCKINKNHAFKTGSATP